MLPSAAIARVVRNHAGDPSEVVRALVAAANQAGGQDNITAVYAEGTAFAAAASSAAPGSSAAPHQDFPARDGRSRFTWLTAGALSGLFAAVVLTAALDFLPGGLAGRTLVVGGTSTGYASIAAAMAAAGPRDVVQIEPGTYGEEVLLRDGVTVKASIPGTVRLVAPPGRAGWVSLTSAGTRGNIVSGLRIIGSPEAPIAVGLKLGGKGVDIDDVTLEGNIEIGIDVQNDGATVLRASRFDEVRGLPLRIGGTATPVIRQNLFIPGPEDAGPAVHLQDDAHPTLDANVFVGYSEAIGAPPSRRERLAHGNYMIGPSERHPVQRSTP
jgi:hypothetical protein